jgi:hypothetical protein
MSLLAFKEWRLSGIQATQHTRHTSTLASEPLAVCSTRIAHKDWLALIKNKLAHLCLMI